MSINWGPALDAEIAYRHQQIRSDFRRPWRLFGRGKAAPASVGSNAGPAVTATVVDAAGQPALVVAPQSIGQHRSAPAGIEASHGEHVRAA